MPDNDLAAAVERLRMLRDGETVPWYHTDSGFSQWKVYYDRETVCDAYLAREAELAKPVDRDWLVSVLGEPDESKTYYCWELNGEEKYPYLMLHKHREQLTGYSRGIHCGLEARGDVYAFLRLADWPTNENGGE